MAKAAKKATKKAPAKKAPAKKVVKKVATKKVATKKAPAKKAAPAKKVTTKKAAPAKKPATKRKPNAAFMKPMTPSATLAAVIGTTAVPRTEAVKKIWDYIKKNNLQNPANKREILADDKLKPLFKAEKITMFELAKILSKHLS